MDKKCETNVLILGKTGVGKTSLFNYIFGADLLKTGAGRPVTGMGLFEETVALNENLTLHLYDSWGLEADKSQTWKSLINEALEEHNVREIKEWFHTIIYCLSAKSARVEAFDLEMIRTLAKDGNPVMVVLTHCDVMNVKSSITAMREVLCAQGNVTQQDIVEVSSHSKTLLGGKQTRPFGKEKIIHRIKVNLLGSISSKMPQLLENFGSKKIEKWHKNCSEIVEKNVRLLNPSSVKKEEKRNELFDLYAQDIFKEIESESDALFNEAYDYYNVFSDQFLGYSIIQVRKQEKLSKITHFQMKKSAKITAAVAGTIFICIPVVGLLGKYAIRERIRAYYKEGLGHNRELLYHHLEICVQILTKELNHINDELMQDEQ
ncbi:GTPase [Acetobacterium bakii]|nr:GTPase domain-containing protein [Acetobacterium bakii]